MYWLIGIGIYLAGFVLTFWFHSRFLQMVIPPLALIRSVAWPLYWTTGWPRGQPLRMD